MTTKKKVAGFVPLKMNNERLPGKNTKLLGGSKPLYSLALESLLEVPVLDSITVFCSEVSLGDLPSGISYLQRDNTLDGPDVSIFEVMTSFAKFVPADVYLMAHATAPFLRPKTFSRMIDSILEGRADSALTVLSSQDFLWADGKPVNYDPESIPRTQDLEPIQIETTGAYAFTADVLKSGTRIGMFPELVEVSKVEAIDINDFEDWQIADAIFRAREHGLFAAPSTDSVA